MANKKASKKDIQLGNKLCRKFMNTMRFNGWLPVFEYTEMISSVGKPCVLALVMKQDGVLYDPIVGYLTMNNVWVDEFGNELENNGNKVIMVKSIENVRRLVDKVQEEGLKEYDDMTDVTSTMYNSIKRKCRLFPSGSPFRN